MQLLGIKRQVQLFAHAGFDGRLYCSHHADCADFDIKKDLRPESLDDLYNRREAQTIVGANAQILGPNAERNPPPDMGLKSLGPCGGQLKSNAVTHCEERAVLFSQIHGSEVHCW